MEVHIEATSYLIRVYEDGKTFANRDPYITVLSANLVGDGVCYLYGMRGSMRKKWREEIYAQLKALGIKTVKMERDGVDLEVEL